MMTSSTGSIFRVTGSFWRESTGHRWIPLTRTVTRSFDVFFDLRMNKRLNKQSIHWWFETPSHPLWCHCDYTITSYNGYTQLDLRRRALATLRVGHKWVPKCHQRYISLKFPYTKRTILQNFDTDATGLSSFTTIFGTCHESKFAMIIGTYYSFIWGAVDSIDMANSDYIFIEWIHTHTRT